MEAIAGMITMITMLLGLAILIGFFVLVGRVGTIIRKMERVKLEAIEQTRYLAAISSNIARAQVEKEKTSQ